MIGLWHQKKKNKTINLPLRESKVPVFDGDMKYFVLLENLPISDPNLPLRNPKFPYLVAMTGFIGYAGPYISPL